MATTDVPPSQTLYINNLNEKIKKDALKKSLYSSMSQYGKVLDIVACRGLKLRGQAWVVFADVAASTNAMRQMQGFPFYDKPMRIAFAKEKSDVVAKKDGTFKPRERKRAAPAPSAPAPDADGAGGAAAPDANGEAAAAPAAKPPPAKKPAPEPINMVPSNVLFAQALPDECNDQMLAMLFQQYGGFREVRMVPGKKGLAFIEFQDEMTSSVALQARARTARETRARRARSARARSFSPGARVSRRG